MSPLGFLEQSIGQFIGIIIWTPWAELLKESPAGFNSLTQSPDDITRFQSINRHLDDPCPLLCGNPQEQGAVRKHIDLPFQERNHNQYTSTLTSLRDGMLRKRTLRPEPHFLLHPLGRCEQANYGHHRAKPDSSSIGKECPQDQPCRIGGMPAPWEPRGVTGQQDRQENQGENESNMMSSISVDPGPGHDHGHDLGIRVSFCRDHCSLDPRLLLCCQCELFTSFHSPLLLRNLLPLH